MKTTTKLVFLATLIIASLAPAQQTARQPFIRTAAPIIALTNVRVIDGTGATAREDQTIIISNGKIQAIAPSASATVPTEAQVLDLKGYSVLPGLVGMHNHMFYPMGGSMYASMGVSFPRLYLALGVTTLRTAGSVQPYADLEIKKMIDSGRMMGPKIHITAPFLEGVGAVTPVMHELTGAVDARRMVNYWADLGATSFKAFMNIKRDELRAVVEEAHKRGLKVTGHLCAVTFREAAEMGIDNLEHGIIVDTGYITGKQPDQCHYGSPSSVEEFLKLDPHSGYLADLIKTLVARNVAVTSTLPVFEAEVPPQAGVRRPLIEPKVLSAMSADARARYLLARASIAPDSPSSAMLKKEMEFERAFVAAGGLLLAGPDPTGNGGVIAGYGDLREVELLVEAGFTPVEAIKIASFNGAKFLGQAAQIGSIAVGKQADFMVVKGNPTAKITDIENVEIVFKDGVGYDSAKLIQSVQGLVGIR